MGERFKADELDARPADTAKELLALAEAALEWIDAVPKETQLPAMPGFDRDWANKVIEQARLSARQQASVEEVAASVYLNHGVGIDVSENIARALLAEYDIFEKVEG